MEDEGQKVYFDVAYNDAKNEVHVHIDDVEKIVLILTYYVRNEDFYLNMSDKDHNRNIQGI